MVLCKMGSEYNSGAKAPQRIDGVDSDSEYARYPGIVAGALSFRLG
jgi:hypothetical protein